MNLPRFNQYDTANARALVMAAKRAYEPAAEIELLNRPTDTRVVLMANGEDLIVAFRGTFDLRNWLTDLDCRRLMLDGVMVHDGFEFALGTVLDQLREKIKGRKIWLTGHSLGGALAMLCAYRLQRECDIQGVYTFGQPRVGNACFREAYNATLKSCTFRIIHADDIVPRVPWLLGAYRHAGHEIFYMVGASRCDARTAQRAVPTCRIDAPLRQKLPSDALGLTRELRRGKLAFLNDHHVKYYVDLLS